MMSNQQLTQHTRWDNDKWDNFLLVGKIPPFLGPFLAKRCSFFMDHPLSSLEAGAALEYVTLPPFSWTIIMRNLRGSCLVLSGELSTVCLFSLFFLLHSSSSMRAWSFWGWWQLHPPYQSQFSAQKQSVIINWAPRPDVFPTYST